MGWQPIISNCAELEKQIGQFKLKNRCHLFCISNGPLFRLLSDLSKHFYIKQLWKMSILSTVLEFEPTTFGKCVSSIWAPAYNCQLLEFPLSERNLKLSEQFIEILSGRPNVINCLRGKFFFTTFLKKEVGPALKWLLQLQSLKKTSSMWTSFWNLNQSSSFNSFRYFTQFSVFWNTYNI